MKKGKKLLGEFKEFISKGNAMNLAVGVIIGGAFQAIVNSLVNDIIMPVVSLFTSGFDFVNKLFIPLDGQFDAYTTIDQAKAAGVATLNVGSFISAAINFFIPSMSAKAAILFPIVRPMCQALGLTAQVGIQAFQIGDQFMNALTPCLGMTVASCSAAGVPFDRYVRFAIRIVAPLWLISIVVLYVLSTIGWMG